MAGSEKQKRMSDADYLKAEEKASVRHEYVDGYVFAMSGATQAHNRICTNLLALLHSQLRGGPCSVYAADMKVQIQAANSYYYPDLVVSCEAYDAKSVVLKHPVLVIEVLSPSTASTDKREKLIAYQKLASLKEYVIVYQDRKQVLLYRRGADDIWELSTINGSDALDLESISSGRFSIQLDLIYESTSVPGRVKEAESAYDVSAGSV